MEPGCRRIKPAMKLKFLVALIVAANLLQGKTIAVSIGINYFSGLDKKYADIKGGDTIILEPGLRGAIQFANLAGGNNNYITIINGEGPSEIKSATLPYGISLRNCHYIKLCGRGDEKDPYGIKISEVSRDGAGLGISDKSDHIEVCFIEICNTKGPGILCKTNPDCVTSRDNFTMVCTSIHHNYVHNTGTEGMYIGSTAYAGEKIKCDSSSVTRFPPVLDTVEVYENRVSYTGWDGIQISNAIHVKCYRNAISFDSQKEEPWQNCGLIIGGGTSGEFSENTIEHGKGYGINCFGTGHVGIAKNSIVMDSSSTKVAIYISDKLATKETDYLVYMNTIKTNHYPAITILNKKGRKPDWVKDNDPGETDLSKAISFEGVKPNIK